jgi:hypothetical protein
MTAPDPGLIRQFCLNRNDQQQEKSIETIFGFGVLTLSD